MTRAFAEATPQPQILLDTIARCAAESLGAYCGFSVVSADGAWLEPVAMFDPNPIGQALLGALGARTPLDRADPSPQVRALVTGETIVISPLEDAHLRVRFPAAADREAVLGLGLVGLLVVPLRVHGDSIGVLALVRHGAGAAPFELDDQHFARALANHAALALVNSRLLEAGRRELVNRQRGEEVLRRIEEASRLKSELLANMSHELRTPLNAIIGFAALLHAGKAGPVSETQHEYLGDILSSSRHLLQLINDVLDLSKIESGRLEVNPERVEIARTVQEVKDILRGLAADRGIALVVRLDPSLPEVVVDERMLKQVLYNYLSNALKFTADGGRVELEIGPHGEDRFRVVVIDDGIGIKPEDLGRLFREFQQLERGDARRFPGTGLGLALTRRIVEAQGGQVAVTSTWGAGSTFSAFLPRVVAASRVRSTPS